MQIRKYFAYYNGRLPLFSMPVLENIGDLCSCSHLYGENTFFFLFKLHFIDVS